MSVVTCGQWVSLPRNQSANKSVSQPISQSVSQSVSKSMKSSPLENRGYDSWKHLCVPYYWFWTPDHDNDLDIFLSHHRNIYLHIMLPQKQTFMYFRHVWMGTRVAQCVMQYC